MLTTAAAATNIFLDILSASPQLNLYETLREEATSTFQSEADWSSPASMRRMTNTDSTIRESLRKSPLQARGLLKQVMPKAGVMLPDGTHVPRGTWLGVPVQAMQRDGKLYRDPHSYDPLRFARLKTIAEEEAENRDDASAASKNLDAAQPSDRYLSFSYGRSAW